jgi:hypothetical protein
VRIGRVAHVAGGRDDGDAHQILPGRVRNFR